MISFSRAIRINRVRSRIVSRTSLARETKLLTTEAAPGRDELYTGDCLVSGLNSAQDILVRAVNCREVVQESILRNDLSENAGQKLAEVMASTLLMGAGLKANETLQVNLVGGDSDRIRNVMVVSDGDLSVRGLLVILDSNLALVRGEGVNAVQWKLSGKEVRYRLLEITRTFRSLKLGL